MTEYGNPPTCRRTPAASRSRDHALDPAEHHVHDAAERSRWGQVGEAARSGDSVTAQQQ
jgi:hypothetical protein